MSAGQPDRTPPGGGDGGPARVAVVGPGAVGGFFAAHLGAAGIPVLSCARRPFDRYVVESATAPAETDARVVTDPADIPAGEARPEWVLVAVKAHQTADAAGWFERLCGPGTTVVTVQNGIEGVERLTPHARGGHVLPAVVYCGAELEAPGHVVHSSHGLLIVPDESAGHDLAALFAPTAARIDPNPAFVTEAWKKLGLNAVLNGITALTRKPARVLHQAAVADLALDLLQECWAVGRAEGAELSDAFAAKVIGGFRSGPGDGVTSMYHDRLAGRATEHDAIYGAIVRAGRRHGLPTPLAAAVQALLVGGDPD